MIFVTVGTQLPFERLIRGMDEWASRHPDVTVFAQVGETLHKPLYMESAAKLAPADYQRRFLQATVVISHCGMGTIITGLEHAQPLVLMPRRHAWGEHRNDHQVATASRFAHFELIDVVNSEDEMYAAVDRRLSHAGAGSAERPNTQASPALIERLRQFLHGEIVNGL